MIIHDTLTVLECPLVECNGHAGVDDLCMAIVKCMERRKNVWQGVAMRDNESHHLRQRARWPIFASLLKEELKRMLKV